jgi:hypothetical protein
MNNKVACISCGKKCDPRGLKQHQRVHRHMQLVRPARLPITTTPQPPIDNADATLEALLDRAWKRLSWRQKLFAIDATERQTT